MIHLLPEKTVGIILPYDHKFSCSKAVGCDRVLESGKGKDRCGICGGNGDQCILESSTYTKPATEYGEKITVYQTIS